MIEWLIPPDVGQLAAMALILCSFATSFITVAFGIGGGAALLAIMASLVPPAALIPVHGVIQAGSNIGRAAVMLRHTFWSVVPAFLVGSVIGAVAGGSLAVSIPPAVVQVGVGLFIIWSVLSKPPRTRRSWPLGVGVFSSFLTMFFGATGPFVATFVKSLHLDRHSHVATHAMLMSLQHVIKTLTFGLLGFAYGPWLGFLAAMIGAGFLGTLAGKRLLNRMGDMQFKRALNIVLILIALNLVLRGAVDLFG